MLLGWEKEYEIVKPGGKQVGYLQHSCQSLQCLVTLIIYDELLADFQLSDIAFPVIRSVLVCVWL